MNVSEQISRRFIAISKALYALWLGLSNLGIDYCKTEQDKSRAVLANRMNTSLIVLLLFMIILQWIANHKFTLDNAYPALIVTVLNLFISHKGWHKISKLSFCILPSILMLAHLIVFDQISNKPFLWYVYAAICFSILPHLIFSYKTEKVPYIITSIYFLILILFFEQVLFYYTTKPLTITPIIKEDFVVIKGIHLCIYL